MFFFALNITAQEKPVKIVFDVTSGDAKVHQAAIRHVKFMSQAYENAEFIMLLQGISSSERKERVYKLLNEVALKGKESNKLRRRKSGSNKNERRQRNRHKEKKNRRNVTSTRQSVNNLQMQHKRRLKKR